MLNKAGPKTKLYGTPLIFLQNNKNKTKHFIYGSSTSYKSTQEWHHLAHIFLAWPQQYHRGPCWKPCWNQGISRLLQFPNLPVHCAIRERRKVSLLWLIFEKSMMDFSDHCISSSTDHRHILFNYQYRFHSLVMGNSQSSSSLDPTHTLMKMGKSLA